MQSKRIIVLQKMPYLIVQVGQLYEQGKAAMQNGQSTAPALEAVRET